MAGRVLGCAPERQLSCRPWSTGQHVAPRHPSLACGRRRPGSCLRSLGQTGSLQASLPEASEASGREVAGIPGACAGARCLGRRSHPGATSGAAAAENKEQEDRACVTGDSPPSCSIVEMTAAESPPDPRLAQPPPPRPARELPPPSARAPAPGTAPRAGKGCRLGTPSSHSRASAEPEAGGFWSERHPTC